MTQWQHPLVEDGQPHEHSQELQDHIFTTINVHRLCEPYVIEPTFTEKGA